MPPHLDPDGQALQAALAGRYHLEAELGRGGMGIVYLARDVALERPVAIKLLPGYRASDTGVRERFLREARLAARLSHPNIVPIYAVEERDGLVYFVMGYIPGETLRARIERQGPLPAAEGARLAQEVAWALGHAHGKGVVHRDVKPDNVILDRDTGRAMVTDFGIARAVDAVSSTGAGDMLGTPLYLSPEQAMGEPVDGRSDLYSLGATLFQALAGRPPFEAEGVHAILRMHLEEPAPPIGLLRPDLPKVLADAVDRCLAKAPEARFGSGEALAGAIGAAPLSRTVPQAIVRIREQIDQAAALAAGSLAASFGLIMDIWRNSGRDYSFFGVFDEVNVLYDLGVLSVILTLGMLGPISASIGSVRSLCRTGMTGSTLLLGLPNAVEATEGGLPSLVDLWVRGLAAAGFVAFGILFIGTDTLRDLLPNPPMWAVVPLYIVIVGLPALATTSFTRMLLRVPAVRGWWEDRLRGRLGRLLVAVGTWRLDRPKITARATAEPTELLVGQAARALFGGLPKPYRQQLAELPDLLERLEKAAERLRAREAEMAQAIVACGAQPGRVQGAGSSLAEHRARAVEDLELVRKDAADRLGSAVGALEALRIDLLRLKAGVVRPDAITDDLAAARQVSEDVDRVLSALKELPATSGS